MRAQPLCHTMLVSEITPMVDVGAYMRVAKKVSGAYRQTGYIYTNYHLFVFACGYIAIYRLQYVRPDTTENACQGHEQMVYSLSRGTGN